MFFDESEPDDGTVFSPVIHIYEDCDPPMTATTMAVD
jgi:hypothetical protein